MTWNACLSFCALLALAAVASAAPPAFYVSPKGNDAWSGTSRDLKAPAGPFATLQHARDELRKLKAAGRLAEGATVNVLPGVFHLAETLTLGPDDSSTDRAPIVWRAPGPDRPVLSGGAVISGFKPYKGKILWADLKAQGMGGKRFGQLFYAGRRQVLARYPNFDASDPHGGTWAHVASVQGQAQSEFFYGTDEQHTWAHPEDGRVHVFSSYDWAFGIAPVKAHDPAERKITLGPGSWYELRVGDRYFIDGLMEELDAPGEWYLDPRTDMLYFWPPDAFASGEVVAPILDNVIKFDGAQYVSLSGFVIEECEGDAVFINKSSHCTLAASVVRNCGANGIVISDGEYSGARGCDVHACGQGGISVGGGDRKTLTPAHNFADNNYIHHCATYWITYRPGVNVNGVGNTVSHNLIHDMPHAGLTLGGNDNVVEYNIVHHTNLQSADTGGIYFCSRDWTQRGNIIRYNIFHHCGGFGKLNSWAPVQGGKVAFVYPGFTWGIYLDDPTTGTLVYGNILYRVPICALHNHGGRDNTFENNVLIDAPAIAENGLDPNWSEWKDIYQRLHDMLYEGSPYLKRYPELAGYADTHPEEMSGVRFLRNIVYFTEEGTKFLRDQHAADWGGPRVMDLYSFWMRQEDVARNEWDFNCIYAAPALDLRVSLGLWGKPTAQATWDEWRKLGPDAHSVLADPLFVDAAHNDYRLRADSPALKLGFKPIPVEKIGLYADASRATWPVHEAPGVSALGDFTTRTFYEPPQYRRLPAHEFVPRGGAPNFFAKAAAHQPLRVAYFGGGINPASGWRAQVMQWLRDRCGNVTEIDASICDCVRGSQFSVFRFAHDVLAKHPDLILFDYASDDQDADVVDLNRVLEGLLRQARKADPSLDIIFLYAFRGGYEKDYQEGLAPSAVSTYERVAEHYAIPSINVGLRISDMLKSGKPMPLRDGVWPTLQSDQAYVEVITDALVNLSARKTPAPHTLPPPMLSDSYERACEVQVTPSMLSGQWSELPADDPLRKQMASHFDTIWITKTPGAKLTFRFRGTSASLFDLMGPDTGRIRITMDGKEVGLTQQVDPWSYYQRLAAINAPGVAEGEHEVSFELLPDAPDRTVPIEAAKRLAESQKEGKYDAALFEGVALRVGCLRLMGELVTP